MFHRVKSDVQDSEQHNQEQPEKAYSKDDERQSHVREDQRGTTQEEASVPSEPRKYGYSSSKTQEEKATMKEEEKVQGKYAPARQDYVAGYSSQQESQHHVSPAPVSAPAPQAATAPRVGGAYQPSFSRSGYGASAPYGAGVASSPSKKGDASVAAPSYGVGVHASDRTLTIGRGINMSGEIDACDHLLVEGTVEAALKGAKVLDIAESGTFYGTVEIEEATIAGRFEGDLTVNGRLTIKASGVITGSISYRELEVEAGSVLDGRMTPLKEIASQESVDRYRAGSEASAMAKVSPKKETLSRTPVNAEGGLFSKARANYS